jgi:hypothetical protein
MPRLRRSRQGPACFRAGLNCGAPPALMSDAEPFHHLALLRLTNRATPKRLSRRNSVPQTHRPGRTVDGLATEERRLRAGACNSLQ